MRLEDRIVRALDDRLDMLDLPAGDLEGALRLGGGCGVGAAWSRPPWVWSSP